MAAPAIVELKTGPSILVRAVWYVLIGWWLTGIVMSLAWFLAITVIGLPLTFYLVNRIPTVLTLRPRHEQYELVTGADGVTLDRGDAQVTRGSTTVRLGEYEKVTFSAVQPGLIREKDIAPPARV